MTKVVINSLSSLEEAKQELTEKFNKHKFLRVSIKTGKDRTNPQNSLTHKWYELMAKAFPEDDVLGWRCYCKLHHGVPILRAEDDEFRGAYDIAIKPLPYEKKIVAMRIFPVTSLMTVEQLTKYANAVQQDFASRGLILANE